MKTFSLTAKDPRILSCLVCLTIGFILTTLKEKGQVLTHLPFTPPAEDASSGAALIIAQASTSCIPSAGYLFVRELGMALKSPELHKQLHEALVEAFPTPAGLHQFVQEELGINLARITTSTGLDALVFDLLTYAESRGSVAALLCAAYNRNPSNRLLSRLAVAATNWPELASAGFVLNEGRAYTYAPRHLELAYLDEVMRQFNYLAEKYTPLAGIAEAKEATRGIPNLDLLKPFMPPEFIKLEEHGSGMQRKVTRVPVEDLREAVTTYKRLVLLGEPGAGKTTTLWRLAYDLAVTARHDDTAPLPLLVALGGYKDDETALAYAQGYIQTHFGTLGSHLPAYLHQGRAMLLLDGLNEMPQHGYRERIGRIQALLDRFNHAPALVTCRAQDYVELVGLEKLEVKPLDPERQRAYLYRYLGEQEGEKLFWQLAGAELRELWERRQREGSTWQQFWARELPPLLALGKNPYMLVMLVWVYARRQGALPQDRGELFAFFVDTLLAREQKRSDPSQWPGTQPLQAALSALAFAMQTAGERGTEVDKAWALAQMDDGCDPQQLLHLAAGATLLDLTSGRVRFVHQLIQEYFTAKYIVDNEERGAVKRLIRSHLTDNRWREVFPLTASMLGNAEDFLVEMRQAIDRLVVDNVDITKLLTWATQKATQNMLYVQPALRSLCIFFVIWFDSASDLAGSREVTGARDLALDLYRALDPDRARALARALDFDLARNRALARALDLDLDLDLYRVLALAPIIARARALARDPDSDLDPDLDRALAPIIARARALARDLARALGIDMGEDVYSVGVEHYGLISNYLYATKLLADCLQVAFVSNRKDIEESLLLPPKRDNGE